MKLLAIETSTEACSVALMIDGAVTEDHRVAPRQHAELVLGMVETLLADAQLELLGLDGIAFGRGPGAFTGVRIAVGVVQGLAFGADLPVVPVSTLQAIAQGALRERGEHRVAAAIDARMGEVYWGTFTADASGLMVPVRQERVCLPGDVSALEGEEWFGSGTGWATYGEILTERLGDVVRDSEGDRLPRARDVAALAEPVLAAGKGVGAEMALPVYLRDDVARKAQKSAAGV